MDPSQRLHITNVDSSLRVEEFIVLDYASKTSPVTKRVGILGADKLAWLGVRYIYLLGCVPSHREFVHRFYGSLRLNHSSSFELQFSFGISALQQHPYIRSSSFSVFSIMKTTVVAVAALLATVSAQSLCAVSSRRKAPVDSI